VRKLASIQKILEIKPINGADSIEVATILGWKVVVKKGGFNEGDSCIYCEIDSVMPHKSEFEFLKSSNYRIKTCKLRRQISQGICFPLSILPVGDYIVGDDVTDILEITKYDPPIPAQLAGDTRGVFPSNVPKTDETRIQASPDLIDEFIGKRCYISEKIDGSSGTFANYGGDYQACTRNLSLKETDTNTLWKLFHKYKVSDIFKEVGNFAIQGEVAGEGIQKNRLKLRGQDFFVFNVYDIDKSSYLPFDEMIAFCDLYHLTTVPILESNIVFDFSLEDLLLKAKGSYKGTQNRREGIVIRPMVETYSDILCGRLSVKVINNDFLLKGGE